MWWKMTQQNLQTSDSSKTEGGSLAGSPPSHETQPSSGGKGILGKQVHQDQCSNRRVALSITYFQKAAKWENSSKVETFWRSRKQSARVTHLRQRAGFVKFLRRTVRFFLQKIGDFGLDLSLCGKLHRFSSWETSQLHPNWSSQHFWGLLPTDFRLGQSRCQISSTQWKF